MDALKDKRVLVVLAAVVVVLIIGSSAGWFGGEMEPPAQGETTAQ